MRHTYRAGWPLCLAVLVLWTLRPGSEASGQGCCSGGAPFTGALEQGSVPSGGMTAGLLYESSWLSGAFRGKKRALDPLKREGRVHTASLEVTYGLTRRISASLVVPYRNTQRRLTAEASGRSRVFSLTGKGLSDLIVLGKLALIPLDIGRQRELLLGAGAKIPTGAYRQQVDGVTLSVDLQPGTGSTDGLLWGYVHQGFPYVGIHLFGSALYRRSGTNGESYRLGDELVYYAGVSCGAFSRVDVAAAVRGRLAGRDTLAGKDRPGTGGHWIYFVPVVSFNVSGISLQLSPLLPLHRNVKGLQLTRDYGLLLATYYTVSPG